MKTSSSANPFLPRRLRAECGGSIAESGKTALISDNFLIGSLPAAAAPSAAAGRACPPMNAGDGREKISESGERKAGGHEAQGPQPQRVGVFSGVGTFWHFAYCPRPNKASGLAADKQTSKEL